MLYRAIILMIVYLDNLEIPSLSRIPRLSRATMVIRLAHTDMERLVDDCIVMDYGKILVQMPVNELLGKFRRYTAQVSERIPIAEYRWYIQSLCHTPVNGTLFHASGS